MSQTAYPDSDIANVTWETAPLWQSLQTTYIIQSSANTNQYCTLGFADLSDPTVHTGHTLYLNAKGGATSTFRFQLREGATVIHDTGTLTLTTLYVLYSFTLSEVEAATITDYTNLSVYINSIAPAGTKMRVETNGAYLVIPDASIMLVAAEGTQVQVSDSATLIYNPPPANYLHARRDRMNIKGVSTQNNQT